MKLRTAARALICKEDKILFSKCKDSQGIFYTLPGGGIEANELAHETLVRECLEETGYTIIVNELVLVKEFIKKKTSGKTRTNPTCRMVRGREQRQALP